MTDAPKIGTDNKTLTPSVIRVRNVPYSILEKHLADFMREFLTELADKPPESIREILIKTTVPTELIAKEALLKNKDGLKLLLSFYLFCEFTYKKSSSPCGKFLNNLFSTNIDATKRLGQSERVEKLILYRELIHKTSEMLGHTDIKYWPHMALAIANMFITEASRVDRKSFETSLKQFMKDVHFYKHPQRKTKTRKTRRTGDAAKPKKTSVPRSGGGSKAVEGAGEKLDGFRRRVEVKGPGRARIPEVPRMPKI